VAIQ